MTEAEHRERHVALHAALDELIADYITHHPQFVGGFMRMPLETLLTWAYEQAFVCTTPAPDSAEANTEEGEGEDV